MSQISEAKKKKKKIKSRSLLILQEIVFIGWIIQEGPGATCHLLFAKSRCHQHRIMLLIVSTEDSEDLRSMPGGTQYQQHPLISGSIVWLCCVHKSTADGGSGVTVTAAAAPDQSLRILGEGKKRPGRVREKHRETAEMEVVRLRLVVAVLVLLVSPAAAARAPPRIDPLPTAALRSFYDTSNYGRLQLNNGLALTPQMG